MILALDTTGPALSVAFGEAEQFRRHSVDDCSGIVEQLFPLLDELCGSAAAGIAQVTLCLGPGSYTGTRSGVAAGLALGFGYGVPIMGLSVFAARILGEEFPPLSGRRIISVPANSSEMFMAVRDLVVLEEFFSWQAPVPLTAIPRSEVERWVEGQRAASPGLSVEEIRLNACPRSSRFAGLGAEYLLRAVGRVASVRGLTAPDYWLAGAGGADGVWYGKEVVARTLEERGFGLVQLGN